MCSLWGFAFCFFAFFAFLLFCFFVFLAMAVLFELAQPQRLCRLRPSSTCACIDGCGPQQQQ
jgi:hypothetical protein